MSFVNSELYDGIKVFSWLADLTGLPIDMINFLMAQCGALLTAGILRGPLKGAPPYARHAICLVLGLFTGYFCFGKKAIHLALLPVICFFLMKTAPERVMANSVLGVAIAYLSCIHLHRQFYLEESTNLDITGPLMIITQRVTSVAFWVHDGREKCGDANSTKPNRDNGGHEALPKLPSPLEFFSYSLAFQTLLCGPALTYVLYKDFIYNKASEAQIADEPNRKRAIWGKLLGAAGAASLHLMLAPKYPINYLSSEPPSEWSSVYLLWFCYLATLAVRCKYYLAWLLADAVCNNAGIGYRAPAKWDQVSNVDIIGFETADTFREAVAKWNPGTGQWLRLSVYTRVKSAKLLKTYALSAIWHGFYPGYYLTFATGALFTLAARKVRKFAQPFAWSTGKVYNALAFTLTRVFMTYATVPFVLLDLAPSIALYRRVYFSLHWVALGALLLPTPAHPTRHHSNGDANHTSNNYTNHTNSNNYTNHTNSNNHTNHITSNNTNGANHTNGKIKAA